MASTSPLTAIIERLKARAKANESRKAPKPPKPLAIRPSKPRRPKHLH